MSWISSWIDKAEGYAKKAVREVGRVYDQIGGNVTSKLGIDYDRLSGEKSKREAVADKRKQEQQERDQQAEIDKKNKQDRLTEDRMIAEMAYANEDSIVSTNKTGSAGLFGPANTSSRGRRKTILGSYHSDR